MPPETPYFSNLAQSFSGSTLSSIYSVVRWLTQAFPLWSKLSDAVFPSILAERESCFLQKPWPTFPYISLGLTALQTYSSTNCFSLGDGYANWLKAIGPILELVAGSVLHENLWLTSRRSISLRAKSGYYWWVKGATTNKWAFICHAVHLNINPSGCVVIYLSRVFDTIYLISKEAESPVMLWWLIFLLHALDF